MADHPEAFEELWWGNNLSDVRVLLPAATPAKISEPLETAWRIKATKATRRRLRRVTLTDAATY